MNMDLIFTYTENFSRLNVMGESVDFASILFVVKPLMVTSQDAFDEVFNG